MLRSISGRRQERRGRVASVCGTRSASSFTETNTTSSRAPSNVDDDPSRSSTLAPLQTGLPELKKRTALYDSIVNGEILRNTTRALTNGKKTSCAPSTAKIVKQSQKPIVLHRYNLRPTKLAFSPTFVFVPRSNLFLHLLLPSCSRCTATHCRRAQKRGRTETLLRGYPEEHRRGGEEDSLPKRANCIPHN